MAWGCLTTNLALPGFGSLLGGRPVGYAQIPFTIVGFGISLIGAIYTFTWYTRNWSRMQQSDDISAYFREFWAHIRWPLLGIALFAFAMTWALITSMSIMAAARAAEKSKPLPPKLRG